MVEEQGSDKQRSEKQNPLGKHTIYPSSYSPDLLFPVPRKTCRDALGLAGALPFSGEDIWTAYEVSWLDAKGKPQVRMGEFCIAADSVNLVESKSLKLYLFSLNEQKFDSEAAIVELIVRDVSACVQGDVTLTLSRLDDYRFPPSPPGDCIDELVIENPGYHPDRALLETVQGDTDECLYSHLLKTNCPVTGQPDWASVWVHYRGKSRIHRESLLAYLVSFRHHQDYHENCIERIFVDLQAVLEPDALSVYGRFTRRGGLDINPFRKTGNLDRPLVRVSRQ